MGKRREELLNVNVIKASDDELISSANKLFMLLENGGSMVYFIYLIVLTTAVVVGVMLAMLNTILGFLIIMVLVVAGFFISMKLFDMEEDKMEPISRKFDEVKKELDERGYVVNVVRVPYGYTYVVHCINMLDIKKK